MLSRFELRRFRGTLPTLALLFAMLVPVIYGAVYLAANWDPYGRVRDLPVALVNDDVPVTYEGQQIQAGKDIQAELVDQHSFQWHVTNATEAADGLAHGRYYLVLRIPRTLSADLVSPAGDHPVRAQITLQRNDANGFVIGSVTGQAQSKIEQAVDKTAVEAYFKAVFHNLGKIRSGLVDAANGSQQITDGLASAKTGSSQLATGVGEANTAVVKLDDGANTLNASMPELVTGATTLQNGLDQLAGGSSSLALGATQVADGTQQLYDTLAPGLDLIAANHSTLATNVSSLNTSVQSLNQAVNSQTGSLTSDLTAVQTALDDLQRANPGLADTKQFQDLRSRLTTAQQSGTAISATSSSLASTSESINTAVQNSTVASQAATAKQKLQTLNDGAHQVSSGAVALNSGLLTASQGSARLTTGVTAVSGGVSQLASGLDQLKDGTGKLATGATDLDSGLGKLADGSGQLTKGLQGAVDQVPAVTADQADQSALVLSQPVQVTSEVQNPAGVYGRGLAPLFFSIAMWVFGISGFLVMRPISGRLLAGRLDPLRLTLSAWLPFGTIAVTGALLMLATTWVGLGLNPVRELAAVALTVLVAVVFSLIAHTMRMALGLPGSALLLVWLILQLSSTGGTYPAAVLPAFFRWLNPLMPITYSIDAFRIVISGGLMSRFWTDVVVLLLIGAVALVADCLFVRQRQRFRIADLHPPLQH